MTPAWVPIDEWFEAAEATAWAELAAGFRLTDPTGMALATVGVPGPLRAGRPVYRCEKCARRHVKCGHERRP